MTEKAATPVFKPLERGARRLVTEVWRLVDQGVISSRSPAGDAALDLRDEIDRDWYPTRPDNTDSSVSS